MRNSPLRSPGLDHEARRTEGLASLTSPGAEIRIRGLGACLARAIPLAAFSIVLICLGVPAATAAPADGSARPLVVEQPDDNNLRLLNVRVGGYVLDGLLPAYARDNIVLVPLGSLAELVDLAVKTNIATGTAQGFLYRENRRFFLDVGRHQVTIAGKVSEFDPHRVHIYPDDIYIDSQLLSKWLPFRLDIDLFSSQLTIKSTEKLPFEQRIERERRLAKLKAQRGEPARPYPDHYEPYAQWRPPFINQTVQANASHDNNTGTTSTSWSYGTYATLETFGLGTAIYVAGDQDNALRDGRITFGRKDPESRLLGPLNATQFAFGFVDSPSVSGLTIPQKSQPGIMVSNDPLQRQAEYDRHTFRGDLLPGWQVELYQNNALIGLQQPNAQGQYSFDNVPLFFGRNYFRLVFYGPQGQVREETYNYDISNALVKPGKHYYNVFAANDTDGGIRGSARYDLGISRDVSFSLGLDQMTLDSQELLGQPAKSYQYGRAGVRSLLGGVFLSGDFIGASDGGSAVELGVQARVGASSSLGVKSTLLNDLVSEEFPLRADPTRAHSEVSLNTALPSTLLPRIPFTLQWVRDDYQSGAQNTRIDNRISLSHYRFAFSNALSWNLTGTAADQLTGAMQLSYNGIRAHARGVLDYQVEPTNQLSSAALTVDGIHLGNYLLSLTASRILSQGYDQYGFRLSRPRGRFAYGVGANYGTNGTVSANLYLTLGVAPEPRTSRWKTDALPVATLGSASARVFIDYNQNGVMDGDDKPLPDVRFRVNGNPVTAKTNRQGVAFLTNLQPYVDTNIGLVTQSLEDPSWVPLIAGVRVVPRPGHALEIEFPVIQTGGIDGTAYFRESTGKLRPAGNVVMELINNSGKIVRTTKSAFDGFYVFDSVPDGTYLVRVSPSQLEKLGLDEVRPYELTIARKNPYVSGINFRLERQQSP
jgi:hypothetical protein